MNKKAKDKIKDALIAIGVGLALLLVGLWLQNAGIYIFFIGFPLAGTLPIVGGIFIVAGLYILIFK